MALTQGISPIRRGTPESRGQFGYPLTAGEKVWRGSLVGLTAAFTLQRIQTAGCVAFAGMAEQTYDNSASASPSAQRIVALKGTYGLTVPGVAGASVNAPVYATDDNTLTLINSGSLLQAGILAGVENSQTFVKLVG